MAYNQIIGNPVSFRIGRKVYLIGYVSMGEYEIFREVFAEDEGEGLMTLITYSLARGGSIKKNIRKRIKKWIKKDPDILVRIIDRIHEISLPSISLNEIEEKKEKEDSEQNIKTVYRLLAKHFTWTPEEITKMSPAQIFISLTGGPECTGVMKQSWEEFTANRGMK